MGGALPPGAPLNHVFRLMVYVEPVPFQSNGPSPEFSCEQAMNGQVVQLSMEGAATVGYPECA
jgi:hypothetical protein